MEFACAVDQDRIDRLITAPRYNETLAIDILRDQYYDWAFRECADIFRTAWELNSRLPESAPRFRIVGLNIHTDYVKENYGTPQEREKEEETHALGDKVMAETIKRETIAKGERALIYSGMHHAFTRYHQLFRMPHEWQPSGLDAELNAHERDDYWYHIRMGNYIYEEIGNRCMTVCLHYPWDTVNGIPVLPFRGVLDQVMLERKKPVAFDLNDSPFDGIYDPELYYAQGYEDYRNSVMTDGYIVLEPITEYEGCSVIPTEL